VVVGRRRREGTDVQPRLIKFKRKRKKSCHTRRRIPLVGSTPTSPGNTHFLSKTCREFKSVGPLTKTQRRQPHNKIFWHPARPSTGPGLRSYYRQPPMALVPVHRRPLAWKGRHRPRVGQYRTQDSQQATNNDVNRKLKQVGRPDV
jgi:hypothetical protein